jgi:putative polyhydroxyalkanoate system protein
MADITITKKHNLNTETLKQRVETLVSDLKRQYGVNYSWSQNSCNLSGSGVKKGIVTISDSSLSIDITLGMLAKMLKPKIESEIDKKIGKLLD